jgi:CelD/BcsL family acetyltransferase involved in cellulose biosynthesis
VLAVLRIADEPLAVIYGFVHGRKFDFYQTGARLTDGPLRSPGISAHLMLMERLADEGVKTYDFLRGSAAYKTRLATNEVPLSGLVVERAASSRIKTFVQQARRRIAGFARSSRT